MWHCDTTNLGDFDWTLKVSYYEVPLSPQAHRPIPPVLWRARAGRERGTLQQRKQGEERPLTPNAGSVMADGHAQSKARAQTKAKVPASQPNGKTGNADCHRTRVHLFTVRGYVMNYVGERRCRQTTDGNSIHPPRPPIRHPPRVRPTNDTALDLISDLDRRFSSARSPVVRFYSHLLELMGKQFFFQF